MTLRRLLLLSTAVLTLPALGVAGGLPKTPAVVNGTVSFASSGNQLTVTETSKTAILNWQDFSLSAGEIIRFVQPNVTANILNRVVGGAVSQIDGLITANGQIMLLNPAGISIGPNGAISAASLLLSSSALADADYLSGRLGFTGLSGQAGLLNQGKLSAADGGMVVLSAPEINNQGSISARLGTVVLGGGSAFSLDPAGDGLWHYQITQPAANALVANSGLLSADGGRVQISARALGDLLRDVINNSGMIEARSVAQQSGEIILDGGTGGASLTASSLLDVSGQGAGPGGQISVVSGQTSVAGQLLARGGEKGGDGGSIETSGSHLLIGKALVDTSAVKGKAGQWLLDPQDLTVDSTAAATIGSALSGGDVTLQTTAGNASGSGVISNGGAGDITVNWPISWGSNHALTLNAFNSITLNAPLNGGGNAVLNASNGAVTISNDLTLAGLSITSGGDVTMNGTMTASAATTINAGGNWTLGGRFSGSALTVNAGGAIAVNAALSAATTSLTAANGDVTTAAPLSASGSLSLVASQGNVMAGGPLSSGAGLTITSGAGDITLNGTTSAGGTTTLTASGQIFVYAPLTTSAGNQTLTANGWNLQLNGPVSVAGAANWSSGNDLSINAGATVGGLTLSAANNILINSNVTNSGNLSLSAGANDLTALGASITLSGAAASAALCTGTNGCTPVAYTLLKTAAALQGLNALAGNYVLANDIDLASINNFAPLGSVATPFTGVLDGLGHQVNHLKINSAAAYLGLFADSGGTIQNLGLINGALTGTGTAGYSGLLAAINSANIINSYSTGSVNVQNAAGGLLGENFGGQVTGSFSSASVVGGTESGGLVGANRQGGVNGAIISQSFATGSVSAAAGGPYLYFGGLLGYNSLSTVTDCFATGAVQGGSFVGGLVGDNGSAHIANSYSSGAVSGTTVGGLVGENIGGANSYGITASYFDSSKSGTNTGVGLISGTPTTQVTALATNALRGLNAGQTGWDFAGTWQSVANSPPLLLRPTLNLVVPIADASMTYGASLPAFSAGSITGFALGDTAALVSGISLAASAAGAQPGVGSFAITGSGGSAINAVTGFPYGFTYVQGSLTVNPAPLTITADNLGKAYGASLPSLTVSYGGFVNGDSAASLGQRPYVSTTATASSAVGSYPISLSGATDVNYSITYVAGTLTVTPPVLTITANDATKVYGQTLSLPATAFSISGLLGGDSVATVSESSAGTVATAAVGGYAITASAANGSGLSKYTITYLPGTLTVTPAPLVITASDASKTYGQPTTLSASGFASKGLVNGDSVTAVSLASSGLPAAADAGSYPIIPTNAIGSGLANYNISYVNGSLTVVGLPLTITAGDAAKTYGQLAVLPGSSFAASGLQAGDSISSVTETSLGSPANAAVGSYPILPGGAAGSGLGKYSIIYAAGTLTVAPAPLTITAGTVTKAYGQTPSLSAIPYSASALMPGDNIISVSGSSPGTLASASVGTYALTPSSAIGGGLSNYAITYLPGSLTVHPALLAINPKALTKIYGQNGNWPVTDFSILGLINGDSVTSITVSSPGAAASALVGSYPATAVAASGSGLGNYLIGYGAGSLNVTPAPLTITAVNTTKPYGQSLSSIGFATSGLANSDRVDSVTIQSDGAPAAAAVGRYPILLSGATGLGLANYLITYAPSFLTVSAPVNLTQQQILTLNGGTSVISPSLTPDIAPTAPTVTTGPGGLASDPSASLPQTLTVDALLGSLPPLESVGPEPPALSEPAAGTAKAVIVRRPTPLIPGLLAQVASTETGDQDTSLPPGSHFSILGRHDLW